MRRVALLLAALALVGSGCSHDRRHLAAVAHPPEHSSAVVSAPARDPGAADLVSPDGSRIASYWHRGTVGNIDVAVRRTGKTRTVYTSNDSCCSYLAWASSRLLVFDDDYHVKTLDVVTGRIRNIAGFSDFTLSHDGRWVAGWADSGGHSAETVGVVSIRGGMCRVVPHTPTEDDTDPLFTRDGKHLKLTRRRFDLAAEEPRGPRRTATVPLSMLKPSTFC